MAYIVGTGVHLPSEIITNDELVHSYNSYVDGLDPSNEGTPAHSDSDFIFEASGIYQRRVLNKSGVLNPDRMIPELAERSDDELSIQAEFGLESAKSALVDADINPIDIDLVICACAHHQRPYPAIGIEIQSALGCGGAAFDMNVACSATTFALHMAYNYINSGAGRNVLVCSPEIMSGHLNFRDRQTHFIFGDASASIVVSQTPSDNPETVSYEVVASKAWTSFSSNIRSNFGFLNRTHPETQFDNDKLVTQQGRKVFKDITIEASSFIGDFLQENNHNPSHLKRFWLHQANSKIIDLIMRKLLDKPNAGEAPIILGDMGNVAAPGSLIAFHHDKHTLKKGELGLICSFGAGYSIGASLVKRV